MSKKIIKSSKGNETDNTRTVSYPRFCSIMRHSDTSWKVLSDLYGDDFQLRILLGDITDAELYDVCKLMGTDFRYVLMLRDDFEYSDEDPLRDPRYYPVQALPKKTAVSAVNTASEVKIVSAKAEAKRDVVKAAKPVKLWHGREHNLVRIERVNERLKKVGFSARTVCQFLGTSYKSLGFLLSQQTLKKGTTGTLAWLLRTTPAYLTGKSDDPDEKADRVVRHVMDNQNFLLNSDYISRHHSLIKKAYNWDDTMIKWLSTADRMVSVEFAKKISKALGMSLIFVKSLKKTYKTESSLVRRVRHDVRTQMQENPAVKSDETVAHQTVSTQFFAVVDAMSDNELFDLADYIESVKKERKLKSRASKKDAGCKIA